MPFFVIAHVPLVLSIPDRRKEVNFSTSSLSTDSLDLLFDGRRVALPLTQSKMVLTRFWRPEEGFYKVGGLGFSIEGDITRESDNTVVATDQLSNGIRDMVLTGALCNMSELRKNKDSEGYHGIGDPTEV